MKRTYWSRPKWSSNTITTRMDAAQEKIVFPWERLGGWVLVELNRWLLVQWEREREEERERGNGKRKKKKSNRGNSCFFPRSFACGTHRFCSFFFLCSLHPVDSYRERHTPSTGWSRMLEGAVPPCFSHCDASMRINVLIPISFSAVFPLRASNHWALFLRKSDFFPGFKILAGHDNDDLPSVASDL